MNWSEKFDRDQHNVTGRNNRNIQREKSFHSGKERACPSPWFCPFRGSSSIFSRLGIFEATRRRGSGRELGPAAVPPRLAKRLDGLGESLLLFRGVVLPPNSVNYQNKTDGRKYHAGCGWSRINSVTVGNRFNLQLWIKTSDKGN